MDTVRFFATNTQPNPVEVDYWVDLSDNPYGGSIKYHNGIEWVRLAASGDVPDLSNYYTKVQVNQLLNDKASVQDYEEVKNVIKNITFRTSNPNEVQMVLAKYDTTTVAISFPKASDVSAGIITSDDFKNFAKQVDIQQLYKELHDSNSSILNAINDIKSKYQKKLTAGSNIKISEDNVISATVSYEGGDIDIDGINSKIDNLRNELQKEVQRSTSTDNRLTQNLSNESATARAAEKQNADNITRNSEAIQKEVTDRNAAIKVETDRATAAESKLANDIVTTVETEKDRAEGVEQVIINDLSEEVTRAKSAEQANKTAINKEVTDRQSAIATEVDNRNAAIEVEKQRALKAEAALDSKIATLESVDTSNFVTLSGTQTIAGKKTFSDIIYFNQQIQGDALSASKLQTARQINGTDFDGRANITTAKWGTSRNLTIGKTTKAVDGSNEVSWLTSEIADNATTTTDGWMSKEDKLALANLNSEFYGKEQVTVSVKKDGVAHSVQINIKNKDNDEVIATSTGSSLTTRIVYGVKYYVSVPYIDGYSAANESSEYTASQQVRAINIEYMKCDEITIDQTVTDPNTMISGDVNGTVLQWIRNNTHRYVAKKTGDGQVTICQLSDNDTTKFYDNLTSSSDYISNINYDVFVRIPRFWYKATETTTNVWKITFSNTKQSSTWKEWDGNDLIGAYEGYIASSTLHSRSNVSSTGDTSQTNFKAYARQKGTGYTLVKWKHHCIVGVLYYALYGNTNCQATIGSGANSYTKNTGLTNSLGMNDSSASATGNSSSINFLGLENWWGNKYEFIDNAVFNYDSSNYKFTIIEDDNSTREVQAHPYTGTFYPTVMVFGEHLDLVMKPNTTSGTTSTGFCDSQYFSGRSNQVVRRSCGDSDADGGVAYLGAGGSASGTGASIGSRLAFRGTIIEEKDIEIFKALK